MLTGGSVKAIYDLHGAGLSIRGIAERLELSRNTVRKYLREPGVPSAKTRSKRPSKLDPYRALLNERIAGGVLNSVVLLRELRSRGYGGGATILKEYLEPHRRARQPTATVRFETVPGEQAQVDWGSFRYRSADGQERSIWCFVLVLSWSRAIYTAFAPKADVATFIRCHLEAFERLGGIPRRCLYDNAKVVVLRRDSTGEPVWNERFLDFALRLGFELRLCRPYRPQTKGRVESGVKYVRGNFWPTARFSDLADLNQQARTWADEVADPRIHGTTLERPAERLVQVQVDPSTIELWAGDQRLAVHPRAIRSGQRFTVPGQWAGLAAGDGTPQTKPLAVEVPSVEVEQRSLATYAALIGASS